jgi:hypothetical protein
VSQTKPISITNGTLVLGEDLLRAAHIEGRARVIVHDRAIVVLPDEDVVEETFGRIPLPTALSNEIAESKELEYGLFSTRPPQ